MAMRWSFLHSHVDLLLSMPNLRSITSVWERDAMPVAARTRPQAFHLEDNDRLAIDGCTWAKSKRIIFAAWRRLTMKNPGLRIPKVEGIEIMRRK